jgi:hypothetical protein
MKIFKTANGRIKMRFSKEDWLRIGYDAKWLKVAGLDDPVTNEDEEKAYDINFGKYVRESLDILLSLESNFAKNLAEDIEYCIKTNYRKGACANILPYLARINRSDIADDPEREAILNEVNKLKKLCNDQKFDS